MKSTSTRAVSSPDGTANWSIWLDTFNDVRVEKFALTTTEADADVESAAIEGAATTENNAESQEKTVHRYGGSIAMASHEPRQRLERSRSRALGMTSTDIECDSRTAHADADSGTTQKYRLTRVLKWHVYPGFCAPHAPGV